MVGNFGSIIPKGPHLEMEKITNKQVNFFRFLGLLLSAQWPLSGKNSYALDKDMEPCLYLTFTNIFTLVFHSNFNL